MGKINPSTPKGTRDFLPQVMIRRNLIFDTLRNVFSSYGYVPIETPAMETLEVLTGKYGEEGDRLIFKILNNGDYLSKIGAPSEIAALSQKGASTFTRKISEKALRYDLTVPFARFVVKNRNDIQLPFKRYQIQPVWRAERAQKGRYREFFQCDADVVGLDSLLYEAELAGIYAKAFDLLGIPEISILINNRKILSGIAEIAGAPEKVTDICIAIDKLDKIGEDGVKTELEKRGIGPDGIENIFSIISGEDEMFIHVSEKTDVPSQGTLNRSKLSTMRNRFQNSEIGTKGLDEMETVLDYLEGLGIEDRVVFDLSLARGLDYYTGTIYEVKTSAVQIGSLGGGGRYDDLTGIFGMSGLSGVGISFGADRIYDVMEELGLFNDLAASTTQVLISNFDETLIPKTLWLSKTLREAGINCEVYPEPSKLGKQFKYAEKKGIPFILMAGDKEFDENSFGLKDLKSGEQQNVSPQELIDVLKKG